MVCSAWASPLGRPRAARLGLHPHAARHALDQPAYIRGAWRFLLLRHFSSRGSLLVLLLLVPLLILRLLRLRRLLLVVLLVLFLRAVRVVESGPPALHQPGREPSLASLHRGVPRQEEQEEGRPSTRQALVVFCTELDHGALLPWLGHREAAPVPRQPQEAPALPLVQALQGLPQEADTLVGACAVPVGGVALQQPDVDFGRPAGTPAEVTPRPQP
mmetsp:Transcript_119290/g.380277  ORF Transcript_119290/g.380277 Transcript_119290/m.380277 type:complete len:216 (+) Transcript_119290:32-679(+)